MALEPNKVTLIPTNLCLQLPEGYLGLIEGTSGLLSVRKILTKSSIIDSEFRQEIRVMASNLTAANISLHQDMAVATLRLLPVHIFQVLKVDRGYLDKPKERGGEDLVESTDSPTRQRIGDTFDLV